MSRYFAISLMCLGAAAGGAALLRGQEPVEQSDALPPDVIGITDVVTQGINKKPRSVVFEIGPVDPRAAGDGSVSLRLRMSGTGVNSKAGIAGDLVLEFDNWLEAHRAAEMLARQFAEQANRLPQKEKRIASPEQQTALERWRIAEGRLAKLKSDLKTLVDAGDSEAMLKAREQISREIQATARQSDEARADYFPATTVKATQDVATTQQQSKVGRLMFGIGVNKNAGVIGGAVLDETNFDLAGSKHKTSIPAANRGFTGNSESNLQRSIDDLRDQIQSLRKEVAAMRELLEKK